MIVAKPRLTRAGGRITTLVVAVVLRAGGSPLASSGAANPQTGYGAALTTCGRNAVSLGALTHAD